MDRLKVIQSAGVSIHAPAGGATQSIVTLPPCGWVSIHAPAGGATKDWRAAVRTWERFNPRARGGRDLITPAMAFCTAGFNPRARGGRDKT